MAAQFAIPDNLVPSGVIRVLGDVLLGFGAVVALSALAYWVGPRLLWGWRGTRVRLALLAHRDGRYAVQLAGGLQQVAGRVQRVIVATESDPAEREAVLVTLRQFSRSELTALLWQVRLLLATGDTDRIRQLHPQIEQETQRWSALTDEGSRDAAAARIAALRQELDARRETGRTWALLVKGMEQAKQDLETLEREMVMLGVSKHQPLTEFRQRISESVESFRQLRAAHAELNRHL